MTTDEPAKQSAPHLPERCRRCRRCAAEGPADHCNECGRFEFSEEILCHLNRSVQEQETFRCDAFCPMLRLVSPGETGGLPLQGAAADERPGIAPPSVNQDKLQFVKQMALQHLRYKDGARLSNRRYHLLWNVTHRIPVFTVDPDTFTLVNGAFAGFAEAEGCFTDMTYLAADHIHAYLSYDGVQSLERMVREMKRFTERFILGQYTYIRGRLGPDLNLWDEAYFSCTAG